MKKLLLITLLPIYVGAMNQQYLDNQLLQAAKTGSVEQVDQLLKAGADKDAVNNDGNTPLHLAALWGNTDAAKLLLEAGADKDAVNNDGYTPLHRAAENDNTDMIKLLLEAGADKDAKNQYGNTPLHAAARKRHTEIVKLLLAYAADPLIKNKQDETVLNLVEPMQWDMPEETESLKAVSQILREYEQLLQEATTNPTHQTLTKAVEHGYTLLVKQLLLKLKLTELQISTLGIIAKNNGLNKIGQILKDYAHALSLQHQTLVPVNLPAEIAYLIAGYTL